MSLTTGNLNLLIEKLISENVTLRDRAIDAETRMRFTEQKVQASNGFCSECGEALYHADRTRDDPQYIKTLPAPDWLQQHQTEKTHF